MLMFHKWIQFYFLQTDAMEVSQSLLGKSVCTVVFMMLSCMTSNVYVGVIVVSCDWEVYTGDSYCQPHYNNYFPHVLDLQLWMMKYSLDFLHE